MKVNALIEKATSDRFFKTELDRICESAIFEVSLENERGRIFLDRTRIEQWILVKMPTEDFRLPGLNHIESAFSIFYAISQDTRHHRCSKTEIHLYHKSDTTPYYDIDVFPGVKTI